MTKLSDLAIELKKSRATITTWCENKNIKTDFTSTRAVIISDQDADLLRKYQPEKPGNKSGTNFHGKNNYAYENKLNGLPTRLTPYGGLKK